jgi:hypothetical protein
MVRPGPSARAPATLSDPTTGPRRVPTRQARHEASRHRAA